MIEYDIPTWILTGALVGVTVLVWKATSHVARATEKVAEVTKETVRLTIMPKISVINHNKIDTDGDHDHYEFILRNDGVGDAFDLEITTLHKDSSDIFPIIRTLAAKGGSRFTNKNVDKDASVVNFRFSYRDYADNPYIKEFSYNIKEKSGYDIHIIKV